ncbi:hypothetical protein P7K49_005969, partial [Saguinus oedipus]
SDPVRVRPLQSDPICVRPLQSDPVCVRPLQSDPCACGLSRVTRVPAASPE